MVYSAISLEVGRLPTLQHRISGILVLRGVRTLVIKDFSYDGQGFGE